MLRSDFCLCHKTTVKQKFVELLDALPITTVGRDYQARRNLLHYRQNA